MIGSPSRRRRGPSSTVGAGDEKSMRAAAQGVRAPADSRDVRGTTLPAVPAVAHGPFDEPDEVRDARSSIVKTVVGSIGLGLAVLIITLVLDDAKSDVARRLALAMAVTLALYGMVSLLVGRRLDAKIIGRGSSKVRSGARSVSARCAARRGHHGRHTCVAGVRRTHLRPGHGRGRIGAAVGGYRRDRLHRDRRRTADRRGALPRPARRSLPSRGRTSAILLEPSPSRSGTWTPLRSATTC